MENTYLWPIVIPILSHSMGLDGLALSMSQKNLLAFAIRESRIAQPVGTNSKPGSPDPLPIMRSKPISIFSRVRVVSLEPPGCGEQIAGTVDFLIIMAARVMVCVPGSVNSDARI